MLMLLTDIFSFSVSLLLSQKEKKKKKLKTNQPLIDSAFKSWRVRVSHSDGVISVHGKGNVRVLC